VESDKRPVEIGHDAKDVLLGWTDVRPPCTEDRRHQDQRAEPADDPF
jgi:hypothetical protein